MTPAALAAVLEVAFAARRPSFASERDLQARIGIELMTAPAGLHVAPEWRLDARDRVDFLVGTEATPRPMGIGVEVKIGGSLAQLTRQLFRYAEHPTVTGLLVVTTRMAHRGVPDAINGRPVVVLCLAPYLL